MSYAPAEQKCEDVAAARDAWHVAAPALRPEDLVFIDESGVNLSVYKALRVRKLIGEAACRLLLVLPYSADFNPVERARSKIKTLLRGVGAHTVDALDTALTTLVDAITRTDARGFFHHCHHCGYAC